MFVPTSFRVYHDLIVCRDCGEGVDDLPGRIERSLSGVSPRIAYLDLTTSLREAARRGELVYRPDDTHWTAAGHRVAAEALSGVLRVASALDESEVDEPSTHSTSVRSNASWMSVHASARCDSVVSALPTAMRIATPPARRVSVR